MKPPKKTQQLSYLYINDLYIKVAIHSKDIPIEVLFKGRYNVPRGYLGLVLAKGKFRQVLGLAKPNRSICSLSSSYLTEGH